MNEKIMTDIYTNYTWGCKETVSGPSSTLSKTTELRSNLRQALNQLQIDSILDCGCGDLNWIKHVDLSGNHYLGVDIVEPLITKNQKLYTTDTMVFQKMDLLQDPPEYADLWIARDFCCLYPISDCKLFLKKFLESDSTYLALSSIDTDQSSTDGPVGVWRQLNISLFPFCLHSPVISIDDGIQWFRKKTLEIYTREQIQTCALVNSIDSLFTFPSIETSTSRFESFFSNLEKETDEIEQKDAPSQYNLHYLSNNLLRKILLRGKGVKQSQSILSKPVQSQSIQQPPDFQNIPLRQMNTSMVLVGQGIQSPIQSPIQNIPLRQIEFSSGTVQPKHLISNISLRDIKVLNSTSAKDLQFPTI
jgi:hypothetical protein